MDQDLVEAVKLYEAAAHGDDLYANSAKCAQRWILFKLFSLSRALRRPESKRRA